MTSIVLLTAHTMNPVSVINTRSMAHEECDSMHNISPARAAKTEATNSYKNTFESILKNFTTGSSIIQRDLLSLYTKGSVQYIRLIIPA